NNASPVAHLYPTLAELSLRTQTCGSLGTRRKLTEPEDESKAHNGSNILQTAGVTVGERKLARRGF
ncbi:hypothetical protein ScPMuIL_003818, partial [Solemya velum]